MGGVPKGWEESGEWGGLVRDRGRETSAAGTGGVFAGEIFPAFGYVSVYRRFYRGEGWGDRQ